MELTFRQKEILNFIQKFILENNYPPTLREIAKKFKISVSTVYGHLLALKKKKVLEYLPYRSRTFQISHKNMFSLPILGEVKAGKPVLAEENLLGYMNLISEFISPDVFLVKVKGDSMEGAGILEDDLVIVKKQNFASPNDIVVALIEGEVTIKRLSKKNNTFWLIPHNPHYQPVKIKENVRIIGKVIGVFRKYG